MIFEVLQKLCIKEESADLLKKAVWPIVSVWGDTVFLSGADVNIHPTRALVCDLVFISPGKRQNISFLDYSLSNVNTQWILIDPCLLHLALRD